MSNAAMNWAWEVSEALDLSSPASYVLICLSDPAGDHSGEDWASFPSIERLMRRTRLSRSAVERQLKVLEAEGLVSRKRRRRADGRLGIYDYTLHRDPAVRAALKAERAQRVTVGGEPSAPYGSEPHGEGPQPCGSQPSAMRQNGPQPCGSQPHQEPLGEPLGEPSQGACAREPGGDRFAAGLAAYPESGRLRTDVPAARAAWALAVQLAGSPGALVEAVKRYAAEDPDLRRGDYGARAFEVWISGERWRAWLAGPAAGEVPNPVRGEDPWAGCEGLEPVPTAVAAAFPAGLDRWLQTSRWDPGGQRLITWSVTARDALRDGGARAARLTVISRSEWQKGRG